MLSIRTVVGYIMIINCKNWKPAEAFFRGFCSLGMFKWTPSFGECVDLCSHCETKRPELDAYIKTLAPQSATESKPCGKPDCGKSAPGITRESCLECVEKHLGAAYVLITETRDGYFHRLRAIGHLHEAEDESQAWPKLHDKIREARKAYQSEGAVPNFALLAKLAGKIREGK